MNTTQRMNWQRATLARSKPDRWKEFAAGCVCLGLVIVFVFMMMVAI